MGILDTLSGVNQRVEDTTGRVLDNERLSVQDNVRSGMTRAFGHDSEEEFAQSATQDYDQLKSRVTDRAANLTDNETLRGAGRGTESAFDLLVGYPAEVAYSSATGVDTRTDNPEHAETGYSPDGLDSLEGLIVAGPLGRIASSTTRGASRVARGDSDMVAGATARLANRVRQGGSTANRTGADDAATATQRARHSDYRPTNTGQAENLTPPPEQTSGLLSRLGDRVPNPRDASLTQKVVGGAFAGGAVLGAAGIIGGANAYPDGYEVDHTYQKDPPADRIRQYDSDNSTVGYWVVVDESGGTLTALDSNRQYMEVEFPTEQSTPFSSSGQADAAYEKWASEVNNHNQQTPAYDDGEADPQYTWGGASHRHSFDYGWHLYRQEHNTQDNHRYFVVGRTADNELIFINEAGAATKSPSSHPDTETATTAFEVWAENAQAGHYNAAPDPGESRPTSDEVVQAARATSTDGNGGGIGSLSTLVAGAAGLGVLAVLIMVIL